MFWTVRINNAYAFIYALLPEATPNNTLRGGNLLSLKKHSSQKGFIPMPFRKELSVIKSPESGAHLRQIWEKVFAGHVTEKDRERMFLDQFLWHVCSWGAVACATREEAIALFTTQEKDKCTIFYQFVDDAYLVENAKELTVEDLPYQSRDMNRNDLYVMDDQQKWTFIMTHEEQCGPYFIKF